MKFLAGFLTMLFIVSVLNCSGSGNRKYNGGMTIMDHTTLPTYKAPVKQEIAPCVCSDDF